MEKKVRIPALTPHFPGGFASVQQLRLLADIAEQYNGTIKFTGNTVAISAVPPEDQDHLLESLGTKRESFMAKAVRGIVMCSGKPNCPMAKQDSTTLGLALDERFFGRPLPGKFRIGVSACPNSCAEVVTKDIGLFGLPNGYTLLVGGNAGRRPQLGEKIAQNIPAEKVPDLIETILNYYEENGQPGERFNQTLDRVGLTALVEAVIPVEYRLS